jgi:hypothetical protein
MGHFKRTIAIATLAVFVLSPFSAFARGGGGGTEEGIVRGPIRAVGTSHHRVVLAPTPGAFTNRLLTNQGLIPTATSRYLIPVRAATKKQLRPVSSATATGKSSGVILQSENS